MKRAREELEWTVWKQRKLQRLLDSATDDQILETQLAYIQRVTTWPGNGLVLPRGLPPRLGASIVLHKEQLAHPMYEEMIVEHVYTTDGEDFVLDGQPVARQYPWKPFARPWPLWKQQSADLYQFGCVQQLIILCLDE